MGVLVWPVGDPTQWTPMYTTNTTGASPWSGKHVSELTAVDLVAILDFCRSEGGRTGWNDALNGRSDPERSSPFHAQLLGGYPYREWIEHYLCGAEDQQEQMDGTQ